MRSIRSATGSMRPPARGLKPRALRLALLLAFAGVAMPRLASAGTIIFSIDNFTYGSGSGPGSFDVVVTETGGHDKLYQYQFDLFLGQFNSHIVFNQAGSSISDTVAPYVFAGNSEESGAGDVIVYPGPATGNEATNADGVINNSTAPTLGTTPLALAHVTFTIPDDTPVGAYPLTFNQDDPNTDPFADWVNTISNFDSGMTSPGAVFNGAILITGPEPSSVVLLLLGAAGLLAVRRRRTRQS